MTNDAPYIGPSGRFERRPFRHSFEPGDRVSVTFPTIRGWFQHIYYATVVDVSGRTAVVDIDDGGRGVIDTSSGTVFLEEP